MPMSIYTVPSTKIVHETKVDFSARHDYCAPIYLVQYDHSIPIIAVTLRNQQASYKLDDSYEVWIRWRKPDNTFIRKKALGCNSSKNVVYFEVTQQMVMMYGSTKPVVELVIPGGTGTDPQVASSASFNVVIERNPVQNGDIQSMDQYEDPYGNVTYTKSQIDANFYNKTQVNANFYNKTQANAKFAPYLIDRENISDNAVGYDQLDGDSVDFVQLVSDITNLLDMINKSNYTLLFDANYKLVASYDQTTFGAGNLNDSTAKYAFISKKVKTIQSGASTKIPNVTNVYINNFSNNVSIASDAFSSSVSITYVNQVPDFNMLDYIAKDLILTHTDIKSKYNASSIEYGTSTLEIYSTQTDITKSATCEYKRVGNTVTVIVRLVMNECTLSVPGAVLHYKHMPFNNVENKTMFLGVSDRDHKVIKGQVTIAGWLQVVSTTGKALSFAQDECIDFIATYRVNKT